MPFFKPKPILFLLGSLWVCLARARIDVVIRYLIAILPTSEVFCKCDPGTSRVAPDPLSPCRMEIYRMFHVGALYYYRNSNRSSRNSTFQFLTDSTASRTLRTAAYTDVNNMTIESCIAFCTPNGYQYAGLEFSRASHLSSPLAVRMLI
jgi:hypothetical protein